MGQIFQNIEGVKRYIDVSFNLDIRRLVPYEEQAIRHIGQFVPAELFGEIKQKYAKVYGALEKATANYMMAFAAPFLKVHYSNTGINNFDDAKMHKSDWWDVRDYSLSAIGVGDDAVSDAIAFLRNTEFSDKLRLFERHSFVSLLFASPKDFLPIYNIGNSWEVLKRLEPIFYSVVRLHLGERLSPCTIEELLKDDEAKDLLKNIIGFYTVSEALTTSNLLATQSGLVVQWEQLPWQKSAVLTDDDKTKLSLHFSNRANDLMRLLLKYLSENADKFPCYSQVGSRGGRKIIEKKSGLYT